VTDSGESELPVGKVLPKTEFEPIRSALAGKNQRPPVSAPPVKAEADFPYLKLLADVRFTVPLLLAVGALWFSYRVVNYPTFADFLIATEAELNKVSWTSRKHLFRDTMVVLVTVVLMTVFLFVVDIAWGFLLSRVGVLQSDTTSQPRDREQEQPW
jgi:preprotein translocase SecE subunit